MRVCLRIYVLKINYNYVEWEYVDGATTTAKNKNFAFPKLFFGFMIRPNQLFPYGSMYTGSILWILVSMFTCWNTSTLVSSIEGERRECSRKFLACFPLEQSNLSLLVLSHRSRSFFSQLLLNFFVLFEYVILQYVYKLAIWTVCAYALLHFEYIEHKNRFTINHFLLLLLQNLNS